VVTQARDLRGSGRRHASYRGERPSPSPASGLPGDGNSPGQNGPRRDHRRTRDVARPRPRWEIHPPRGLLAGGGCVGRSLTRDGPVRVICTRITTTHPGIPGTGRWIPGGARASWGFGWLPPTYRGSGVRIAADRLQVRPPVIRDLSGRIEHGRDLIGRDEEKGLAGRPDRKPARITRPLNRGGETTAPGLSGSRPEAEIHVCRVSPGGSAADLIEALDYCIEQQVDVAMFRSLHSRAVGCSLAAKVEGGSAERGDRMHRRRRLRRRPVLAGRHCRRWLAVGAIGQLGYVSRRGDTDTATLTSQLTPEGFFCPPRFSSGGPGLLGRGLLRPWRRRYLWAPAVQLRAALSSQPGPRRRTSHRASRR